jgi:hypothetical protein
LKLARIAGIVVLVGVVAAVVVRFVVLPAYASRMVERIAAETDSAGTVRKRLEPGERFSAGNGLSFVVPADATATVYKPYEAPGSPTELIEVVEPSKQRSVQVLTFAPGERRSSDATVVAQSASVVVRDVGARIRSVVDVGDSGRVVIMVEQSAVSDMTALELAREVWDELGITGAKIF